MSRQAPGREGELTGTPLAGGKPSLTITEQGKAEQIVGVREPVVMAGVGVMATASSAAVFNLTPEGVDAGLMAAPCLAPGTTHWFTGLGATDADRTELVLTNADDAQASVDLRFYGPDGRVVVPGSPGLVIEARSTATVSLSSLVKVDGPLAVAIQASQGRVSAVAKRTRADGLRPIGVDWQVPSPSPRPRPWPSPGCRRTPGARELVVTNPGTERASVSVSVLGLQGPYAPSGAETVEVAAESSAPGRPGRGSGRGGRHDQAGQRPAGDRRGGLEQPAQRGPGRPRRPVGSRCRWCGPGSARWPPPVSGDGELVLSNTGTKDAAVSFEVLSFDGVVLRTDDVLLGPDSTATRRLLAAAVLRRGPGARRLCGGRRGGAHPGRRATWPAWRPSRSPRPTWPAGPRAPRSTPSVGR